MKMHRGLFASAALWLPCMLFLSNAGCTGPMGASAPNTTPICYYCNNFDSGGVNGWMVQQGGGNGPTYVYLDNSMFSSPSQSLGVSCTGLVGNDAQVYRDVSIDSSKDLYVEFDLNLTGSYNAGQEFFINLGGTENKAVLGWDTSGFYLVQGSSHIVVYPNPTISMWHHIKIQLTPKNGKSNYWMDGLVLGVNYTTTNQLYGAPAPSGYLLGLRVTSLSRNFCHLDNLQCYHL